MNSIVSDRFDSDPSPLRAGGPKKQGCLESLAEGAKRSNYPLPNIHTLLEDQTSFNSEVSKLFSHGEGISIDLSADFNELKGYQKSAAPTHEAIGRYLENQVNFVSQVLSDLHADIDSLAPHFQIVKEDISKIALKSVGSDSHNKGKATLFIELELKNGQKITLVYKPRTMILEWATCDHEKGVFTQIKGVAGIDQLGDVGSLTYPVMAIEKEGRHYGYSLKVEGNVLHDDTIDYKTSLPQSSPFFMAGGSRLTPPEFLELVRTIKEKIQNQKPGENIEEFISNLSASYGLDFKGNSLEGFLKVVLKESFFSERTDDQLKLDYLTFFVLSQLQLGDLHGGNFVQSSKNKALVPIDLECFQEGDANEFYQLIIAEMEQRNILPAPSLLENITSRIEETTPDLGDQPYRFVLIGTHDLYEMRDAYLEGDVKRVNDEIFEKISGFVEVESREKLEGVIKSCFTNFDIPYFVQRGSELYFDETHIGSVRT